MWILIDRKLRFTLLVALVLIIAVIYMALAFHAEVPSSLQGVAYQFLKSIFSAIGTATLLITLLGGRQFLWRLSLGLPAVKGFLKFPDVNGVWIGPRKSSYLESEATSRKVPAPPGDIMRLTIRQSWLRVQVDTVSHDRRTVSRSVYAFPEIWQDRPLIWSVYRSEVEGHKPTEGPGHNGGALLHVTEEGGLRIFGTYFSDRGIAHYKPSSGTFNLWRFATDPDHEAPDEKEVAKFLSKHQTAS
jgi:hypothetical protein